MNVEALFIQVLINIVIEEVLFVKFVIFIYLFLFPLRQQQCAVSQKWFHNGLWEASQVIEEVSHA